MRAEGASATLLMFETQMLSVWGPDSEEGLD